MSNFKLIGHSKQFICFKYGPAIFTRTPKRNMSTPGISARSLYRCYHQISLRPNRQNFLYETSLRRPAIAAMSDGPEIKPIQKGEGAISSSEKRDSIQTPSTHQIKTETPDSGLEEADSSKLTIQDIMQKFKHPIYDSKVQKKRKLEKTNNVIVKSEPVSNKSIKNEAQPKKLKTQSGGTSVFKFY